MWLRVWSWFGVIGGSVSAGFVLLVYFFDIFDLRDSPASAPQQAAAAALAAAIAIIPYVFARALDQLAVLKELDQLAVLKELDQLAVLKEQTDAQPAESTDQPVPREAAITSDMAERLRTPK